MKARTRRDDKRYRSSSGTQIAKRSGTDGDMMGEVRSLTRGYGRGSLARHLFKRTAWGKSEDVCIHRLPAVSCMPMICISGRKREMVAFSHMHALKQTAFHSEELTAIVGLHFIVIAWSRAFRRPK
jgi:hypothetical protein